MLRIVAECMAGAFDLTNEEQAAFDGRWRTTKAKRTTTERRGALSNGLALEGQPRLLFFYTFDPRIILAKCSRSTSWPDTR
jgi:hypothetical protein